MYTDLTDLFQWLHERVVSTDAHSYDCSSWPLRPKDNLIGPHEMLFYFCFPSLRVYDRVLVHLDTILHLDINYNILCYWQKITIKRKGDLYVQGHKG